MAYLDDMSDAIDTLKGEKAKLVVENTKLQEELGELTMQMEQFRNIQNKLCNELKKNYEKTEKLTEEKCHLESLLNGKDQEIKKLEKTTNEIKTLEQRIQCLQREIESGEDRNEDVEKEGKRLENCLHDKELVLVELEGQYLELQCDKSELEPRSEVLLTDRMKLRKDLEERKTCLNKALMKLYDTSQCTKIEDRTKQLLSDQICHLKLYIEQTEQNIYKEKEKGEELAAELKLLETNIQRQCTENTDIQMMIDSTMQRLNQCEQCLQETTHMTSEVKKEFGAYKNFVQDLKGQIAQNKNADICMRVSQSPVLFSELHCPSIDYNEYPNFWKGNMNTKELDFPSLRLMNQSESLLIQSVVSESNEEMFLSDRRRRRHKTVACSDRHFVSKAEAKRCNNEENREYPVPEVAEVSNKRRCNVSNPKRQNKYIQVKGNTRRKLLDEQEEIEIESHKKIFEDENDAAAFTDKSKTNKQQRYRIQQNYKSDQRMQQDSDGDENQPGGNGEKPERPSEDNEMESTGQSTKREGAKQRKSRAKKSRTKSEKYRVSVQVNKYEGETSNEERDNFSQTELQSTDDSNITYNTDDTRKQEETSIRRCCVSSRRKNKQ